MYSERRCWSQLRGVMSVSSAQESSATQFDHESVTACCCETVSLSHTSLQKVSPVKPKPASPWPKRWPKHSATAAKSPQGRGKRREAYPSQLCRHLYSSLIPSPYLEWGYLHSRHWAQDTYNLRTLGCTVQSVTWNATANFSYIWILLYSGSRNTQSSECTVASVEHVEMFHGKSHNW